MISSNANCTISLKTKNQTIISIYVHYDGQVSGVGTELLKYYTTVDKVQELIKLGTCSTILGAIKAYHRDMGEEWSIVKPKVFKNYEQMLNNYAQEYNYLYDNIWYITAPPKYEILTPLTAADAQI